MPPRTSLKAFLATARAALAAPPSKRSAPLTFVVGNESADLDSLCSALLLAYFHTYAPPPRRGAASDGGLGLGTLHIPVCHLYRADLALRPEFAAVLRDADVRGEDVFTLEDVLPPPSHYDDDKRPGKEAAGARHDARWLLVDHNAMTGPLARAFAARVVGCVDHHADEGAIPPDADIRVLEKSGSCMSLVVERCGEIWGALGAASPSTATATTTTAIPTTNTTTNAATTTTATTPNGVEDRSRKESAESAQIDAQLARVALAPILIDTSNLRDATKTTAHDEAAVATAEGKLATRAGGEASSPYTRDAFYARLLALKEDLGGMTFRDIFRKDYKEWGAGGLRLGTSSAPRGFAYLVDGKSEGDVGALVDALGQWGVEKDAEAGGCMDLVALLTGFQDAEGRFRRELLVWARSEAGVRAARRFEERWAQRLGLSPWRQGALDLVGGEQREWRRGWEQSAVEHSRKQIAPMLRDALREVAGE